MRGLFSAGIIDVMMERETYPDGLIGVSAGAAFGCNMKSRQPGRVIRYNKQYAHDWRYCSMRSLITTGDMFGGEFCYHYLPQHLDIFDAKTFDANPMAFYAVCTDVDTGQPVYRQLQRANDECYEWIRASASMPGAARIVKIGSQRLLDVGIADSIPLQYFQRIGYRRNMVVLTQPRDYVKTPNKLNPLIHLMLRRHPTSWRIATQVSHVQCRARLYTPAGARRPHSGAGSEHKLPVGHICHDTDIMQQVYDMGRQMARSDGTTSPRSSKP
jgi:predicted patatin/cPLA2 family phospholipase